MIKDKSILIANIYYMLSYAYRCLQQKSYEEIKTESFENIQDLFAAILAKGITAQLKQGLNREYIERQDILTTLRGKMDLLESMRIKMRNGRQLSCRYDEMSENHYMNQILKTAALCLISDKGVKDNNKKALKRAILFFSEVDTLEPSTIDWRSLRYNRNNATYKMMMNICYLILHELLLTTERGKQKLAVFLDEQQMSRLYEKFILEYYKKHFPQYRPTPKQITWDTEEAMGFLPIMQSDIMLTNDRKKLIIDAKYYQKSMQTRYETDTIRSDHLYQIFTYVKNEAKSHRGLVDGVLLYAKTDEEVNLNRAYELCGNRICVNTLDLNNSFVNIRRQLDKIIEEWLN